MKRIQLCLPALLVLFLLSCSLVEIRPANPPVAHAPTSIPVPTQTLFPPNTPHPPTVTPVPSPTNTPTPDITATPLPAPTETASLSPEKALEVTIRDSLGGCNRDIPRVADLSIDEEMIYIKFALQENLGNALILRGAQMDIKDILRAASEYPGDYGSVFVIGTFPLEMADGAVSEMQVIRTEHSKATVGTINWDNFITDDVLPFADFVWIHKVFQ